MPSSNVRQDIVFASAARTADPTPVVLDNNAATRLLALLYITSVPTNLSNITMRVENFDPASNVWTTVAVNGTSTLSVDSAAGGSAPVIATAPHAGKYLIVQSNNTTSSTGSTFSNYTVNGILTPQFRIRVVHSNSESWTYSVSATWV